jgi:sulfur relay (sulfurtransferase) complex TusBCD TusD component (DsrE family)
MTTYVLIESRDPFESRDTTFIEQTAVAIKERGHAVTVFLVQNGVLAARKNIGCLSRLAEAGVTVIADDLSLRERGIQAEELAAGIREAGIGSLVDALVNPNTKAVWH